MTIGYCVVNLAWDGAGSPGTNTWHLRTTGSDFDAADEVAGLMGLVKNFYTTLAVGPNGVLRNGLTMTWNGDYHGLASDVGKVKGFPGWTVTSTMAGNGAAAALCGVINWKTSSGGRKGKGRTFLGPLLATSINDKGELSSTYWDLIRVPANKLVSDSQGFANGSIAVHSRTDGLSRDVTSAVVSKTYGVLRSRRD